MSKCKYCQMPIPSQVTQMSRIEMKYIQRDIPDILKSLKEISRNLEKIADISEDDKGNLRKIISSASRSMGGAFGRSDFYLTRGGQRFYEGVIPNLVKELEALNKNLEKINSNS